MLSAARGRGEVGLAVALVALAVHARFLALRGEWRLWIAFASLGVLVDCVLASAGVLVFREPAQIGRWTLVPSWIGALWLMFATAFPHSLAWLAARPGLAALSGALGGPLSYRAAVELGALRLHPDERLAYGLLALEWALLTPCGPWLARLLVATRVPDSALQTPPSQAGDDPLGRGKPYP